MKNSDVDAFWRIFESYVRHVTENPDSLLARIYGVYTIKMKDTEPVHVILMANTKRTYDDKTTLLYTFDLKGSLVNRELKAKKGEVLKASSCRKDENLIKLNLEDKFLRFSRKDQDKILDILCKDTNVLKTQEIMDYSLLLAVENNNMAQNWNQKKGPVPSIFKKLWIPK
jgi:Phosphatidylinositol-4-phosphate 5-Kinase